MKTLSLIVLAFLLVFNTSAQMSLQDTSSLSNLYKNMEYMQYKPVPVIEGRHPTHYGAGAVLLGTFLINHMIIVSDERKGSFETTTRKVGTMYVAGVTLSIGVFVFENRKARWEKLYDDLEQEENHRDGYIYYRQIIRQQ